MGIFRNIFVRKEAKANSSKSKGVPVFENLEPRILLSGDGLLSSLNSSDGTDNSLQDNISQAIECEYTQLTENNNSTEIHNSILQEENSLDQSLCLTDNQDSITPLFSVSFDGENEDEDTKTKSEDDDIISLDNAEIINAAQDDYEQSNKAIDITNNKLSPSETLCITTQQPIEYNTVLTIEEDSQPILKSDADLSIDYLTSIEPRGPPINEIASLTTSEINTYAISDEILKSSDVESASSLSSDLSSFQLNYSDNSSQNNQILELFNASPALFIENQGQWSNEEICYLHNGSFADVAITDSGVIFHISGLDSSKENDGISSDYQSLVLEKIESSFLNFSSSFIGSNKVQPIGLVLSESTFNYFIGDQSIWRENVPSYELVLYQNIYDGIDLQIQGLRSHLKYEFLVTPGVDWSQIAIKYEGIEGLSLGEDGSLLINLGPDWGVMQDDAPYIYQEINGERIEVAGKFVLLNDFTYSFEITGNYDPNHPLVIDPNLAWGTYLGGENLDRSFGIDVNESGEVYVTGYTDSLGWINGGFNTNLNGEYDGFVTKLSESGEHIWSTYLGGEGLDYGVGITIDSLDNVLITGHTSSSGWISGGFDTILNGYLDGFVVKLSGSGEHIWSSYLGGQGEGIAVDSFNNILITGETGYSGWASGGYDTSLNGGGLDGFVIKLSESGEHIWSTYIGGGGIDFGFNIIADHNDNVFVTGETSSSGWVSGGFDTDYNEIWFDCFIVKLTPLGEHAWSTYVGGSDDETGLDITIDSEDNVIVTGETASTDFISGGYDTSLDDSRDVFVMKLTNSGSHIWSTYLGGISADVYRGIAVDAIDNIYIAGSSGSSDWFISDFGSNYNGELDCFLIKLSPDSEPLWGTFLGGTSDEFISDITLDESGYIYLTGDTYSSGWINNGYNTTYSGNGDGFVVKLFQPADLFEIAVTDQIEFAISSAFDGEKYLVGIRGDAEASDNVSAQFVDVNGNLVGDLISTGRTGDAPYVIFGNGRYLMVWTDTANSPNDDIYGQFISTSGTLEGSPFVICSDSGKQEVAGIAFNETNYLVIWLDRQDESNIKLYGQLLGLDGSVVGTEFLIDENVTSDTITVDVESDGENFLVAWSHMLEVNPNVSTDIWGRIIQDDGSLDSPFLISEISPGYDPITLAYNSTNYLITYHRHNNISENSYDVEILGQLVAPDGTLLNSAISLVSSESDQVVWTSGLASNGDGFLLTWHLIIDENNWEIYTRQLNDLGIPQGETKLLLRGEGEQICGRASYGKDRYLCVITDESEWIEGELEGGDVYGTFVKASEPDVAVEYIVDSLADNVETDGFLTLREAIEAANSNTAVGDAPAGNANVADIIHFDSSLTGGTILLGSELVISDDVIIEWLDNDTLTVDGDNNSRVFYVDNDVQVSIKGLIITGGNSINSYGGGIYNNGITILIKTVVSGNSADSGGGGIYNMANLSLINTAISGNSSGDFGGGIFNNKSILSIKNSVFSGNKSYYGGGGIYSNDGNMTITNATICCNTSENWDGGGICNTSNDILVINNSIVALNESGWAGSDIDGYVDSSSSHNFIGDEAGIIGLLNGENGNIIGHVDPLFVRNPSSGSDGIWGTEDDDYGDLRLQSESPCIDAGNNTVLPIDDYDLDKDGDITEILPIDINGNLRVYNEVVDIGAYEFITNGGNETPTIYIVDSLADNVEIDGYITLREALEAANTNIAIGDAPAGNANLADIIHFDSSLTGGTILLGSELVISDDVIIEWLDNDTLPIDADNNSRVFYINSGIEVAITGLGITGGQSDNGGGIYNAGTLIIKSCTISGNYSSLNAIDSSSYGGGIYNSGTLNVMDSTIFGNSATSSSSSGYSNAKGGGIFNNAFLTISNCIISGNKAKSFSSSDYSSAYGGGIFNNSILNLTNCIISGNSTSAESTTYSPSYGGGIYNNAKLIISSSTITGNFITSSSLDSYGGGIYNYSSTLTLNNTIICFNEDQDLNDAFRQFTQNRSLIGIDPGFIRNPDDGGDGWGIGNNDDYGDLRLKPNSIAINFGDNSFVVNAEGDPLTTDINGNTRIVGGIVDIGACEYQDNPLEVEVASTTVTTLQDIVDLTDGLISIREALVSAWFGGFDSHVTFESSFAGGTINLSGEELLIYESVTVDASDIGFVTLNAGSQSRVVDIQGDIEVMFIGLTISGGSIASRGGGIYNASKLAIVDCLIADNTAFQGGGGIYNRATLTLMNSKIEGNSSFSNFTSSSGGAIYNDSILSLRNSLISNNSSTSTFSNSYGGGIFNNGTLTLENCTISNNCTTSTSTSHYDNSYGGGIYNSHWNATVKLMNCRITGNSCISTVSISGSSYGGGIFNHGSGTMGIDSLLILTNCVITGNSASSNSASLGGGIYNWATSTITNCTISGNSSISSNLCYGGGIYIHPIGMLTMNNTIVAFNHSLTDTDISGTWSGSSNLIGVDPGFVRNPSSGIDGQWGTADDDFGDLHLASNSTAINQGDNALAVNSEGESLSTDLDENPRIVNGTVDIGAYELLALPDLAVTDINSPIEGWSGQIVQYSWAITNQGNFEATGSWYDHVFLSEDQIIGNDISVGSFIFSGSILTGESITRIQTFELPIEIQGDFWIIVVTDYYDVLDEGQNESNNWLIDNQAMAISLSAFANLQVTDVISPAEAFSSQDTVVEWVVTNTGTGSTNSPSWYDYVWLSHDAVWSSEDQLMGSIMNPAYLLPNDSYTNSLTITLPQGIEGNYYFIVKTDYTNTVYEYDSEDDNTLVGENIYIKLTPPPDLVVSNIIAPDQAFSNQAINITWTVINNDISPISNGVTLETYWYDKIYLSKEPNLNPDNWIYMGGQWHNGALGIGESYTSNQSITVPVDIDGLYYFIVVTDSTNMVYEHAFEDNNGQICRDELDQPKPISITLTPPDLEVDYVDIPSDAQASYDITFSYQVTNYGVSDTPNNYWTDSCYLSTDTILNVGTDILIGNIYHYGSLEIFGNGTDSYTQTVTYTLPHGIEGDYYILVVTDSENTVFEGFSEDIGENNNISSSDNPSHIVSNHPDLVIVPDSFKVDSTAMAGSVLLATWEVANQGVGGTVGGTWTCSIYASQDNVKGDADDRLLATFTRSGNLGPDESYIALDKVINMPIGISGDVYLWVRTDANNQIYEGSNENNNDSELVPITVIQHLSDLQVIAMNDITGPVTAGDWLTVTWTVENTGVGRTNALSWRDSIYLSSDTVFDKDSDIILGSLTSSNPLDIGETYTVSKTIQIPLGVVGPLYLGVFTDVNSQVYEGIHENNNFLIKSLGINPGDPGPILPPTTGTILYPDLTITEVDAPFEAYSGQSFNVSWTVQNNGDIASGYWYDNVYLSLDQFYDPGSDISLGHRNQSRTLNTGESYTASGSFEIPRGFSGPFYVFVVTDRGSALNDSNLLNNINYDHKSILVNLVPPADLVVGLITVPTNASPGVNAEITYTVENQGEATALGSWYDSIYISKDDIWDIDDTLFGRYYHTGNIAGHSTYTHKITELLPGVVSGDYHIIVRSDILNHIPEKDETNNIGASLDSIRIDAQILTLGVPQNSILSQGYSAYYRVEVPEGETLMVLLEGQNPLDAFELFVSYDQMPSRTHSDYYGIEPFRPDQRIVVSQSQAGSYYILIRGNQVAGNGDYTILVDTIQFSVFDDDYGRGGTAGNLTIQINGAKFDRTVKAKLSDNEGFEHYASEYYYENETECYATFDLREINPGFYDVIIEKHTGESVTVTNGLEVVQNISIPEVIPWIEAPESVRRNMPYQFTVLWANTGLNDVYAPLLTVGNTVPFGLSTGEYSLGTRYTFLGINTHGGPAGILRPGQSEMVTFFSYSDNQDGDYQIFVDREGKDPSTTFDWESLKPEMLLPGMTEDEFNPIFEQLKSQVGSTWGDYLIMLSKNASLLPLPDKDFCSEKILLELEVLKAWIEVSDSISGICYTDESSLDLSGLTIIAENVSTGDSLSAVILNDGSFYYADIEAGNYILRIQNLEVTNSLGKFITIVKGSSVEDMEVYISRGTQIFITLVDSFTDEIIPNSALIIGMSSDDVTWALNSKEPGIYWGSGLQRGLYTIQVDAEGYGRQYVYNVNVNSDYFEMVIKISVEGIISGQIPNDIGISGETGFAIAILQGEVIEEYFYAEIINYQFQITGLPSGVYNVITFLENFTGQINSITVQQGQEINIGVIESSDISLTETNSSNDELDPIFLSALTPPLWMIPILIDAELYLNTRFLPLELLKFGPEVAYMWYKFINSSPTNPTPEMYKGDGSQVVEGWGGLWAKGFREDTKVNQALDDSLEYIADILAQRFAAGDLDCSNFNGIQIYEFNSLIDIEWNDRYDIFHIPGHIAGGISGWYRDDYTFRPDTRWISGYVIVNIQSDNSLRVESRLKFNVQDSLDFNPGGTGAGIEWIFTQRLKLLETYGWAYGVPYKVALSDKLGERVTFRYIPDQDCEDDDGDTCDSQEPPDDCENISRPRAVDPNDIIGPQGYGQERWIPASRPLNYTIRFENDSDFATSPAQVVRITHQLDSDLDPRSFRVGNFGFGELYFEVPDNQAFYTTRIDLIESKGIYLDVVAGIDIASAEAFWQFTTIDPETGEIPTNAFIGFLPPNDSSPEGLGFVTFTVRARQDVETGTRIDAMATISFDVNEPVETPLVFNTLDAGVPISQVSILPEMVEDTNYIVSWKGSDDMDGSGLANFDIYVSEDDKEFRLWLDNTVLTEAIFKGDNGKTYKFYSIASDNAGNVESSPQEADAITKTGSIEQFIELGEDVALMEGDLFSLSGVVGNIIIGSTASINYGDGTGQTPLVLGTDGSFSLSHTYQDNGNYTLIVSVEDPFGTIVSDSILVTASNIKPVVNAGSDQDSNEGQELFFVGSFTDPGTLDTHAITWDFGDGTTTNGTLAPSHVYADNGIYTVTLTVIDDDGGIDSDISTITITNVVPNVSVGDDKTINGSSVVILDEAVFNDPGTLDTHTAIIDWGDGTDPESGIVTELPFGPPGSVLGVNGTVSGSHIYSESGIYTITVTITDDDGASAADAMTVRVIINEYNLPYIQDFESGLPGTEDGWEYYSSREDGRIEVVDGRLRMDDSTGSNYEYNLNEAILYLDLTSNTNVTLTFDHVALHDEHNPLPWSYEGHYKGDGVSLSLDGINWIKVTDLTVSFYPQSYALYSVIEHAKTAAGSDDVSNVRIKFQQYDNYPVTENGGDGREFDNIHITPSQIQTIPYGQDFESGLPGTEDGWEYYSSREDGRIEVVDGRLRMDDSTGSNYEYNLNEAILHLDLTSNTNVTLTFDHVALHDEHNPLPSSYEGHYKGDGVSLSVDGINWVKVTDLTTSFYQQSFTLLSIIEQAKIAAGSNDVTNVRIKFQQYDNYPVTENGGDGREFDNIQINPSHIQSIPYNQDFESGLPGTEDGWEYYSSREDGRIEVVDGRLRMDDSTGSNYEYNLNEAILYLDLTSNTNVTLTFDHFALYDEYNPLPSSYIGHYKGDGVSLSIDGINWITITSLSGSFISRSFELDSIIDQAKIVAGSEDVSDVRIKFQQYDNYPVTESGGDGREFDNIMITDFI